MKQNNRHALYEHTSPAERLEELRALLAEHGYDDSGLARLTPEERDEYIQVGGDERDLLED